MKPVVAADELLDVPGFPAPAGARVEAVRTRDGVELRAASWLPETASPRGTILILQGRAEFVEKYFEVVAEILERGFAVLTFDWRGQGGSGRSVADGRKGHVRSFEDFRLDVEAVAARLAPPLPRPLHVVAHSMGGCIALAGAAEGWLPAERLVASTPMIALRLVRRPRLVRVLARLLFRLGFGERFVPGGTGRSISTEPFRGNRLSGDERRYARNAAVATALGAAAIGAPTIGWLRAAYEAMDRFELPGFAQAIAIPTLVVGAGDDPVCATEASERFARGLNAESSFLLIPGSRHEIMMESDPVRAAFWAAVDRFLASEASAPEALQDRVVETSVARRDDVPAARR